MGERRAAAFGVDGGVGLPACRQENDKQDARAGGFDYHLVKPINFDALMALTARP